MSNLKYGETFFLAVCHNNLANSIEFEDVEGPFVAREAAYDHVEDVACEHGGTFTIYECRPIQLCDEDAVRAAAILAGKNVQPIEDD